MVLGGIAAVFFFLASPTRADEIGAHAHRVDLVPFSLKLLSGSRSNTRDFLLELRTTTSDFVESYFYSIFTDSLNDEAYHFDEVVLAVKSVSMHEDDQGPAYSSTVVFEGAVYFTDSKIPGQKHMDNHLAEAFDGDTKKSLLYQLQLSSDAFLAGIEDIDFSYFKIEAIEESNDNGENKTSNTLLIIASVCFSIGLAIAAVGTLWHIRKKENKVSDPKVGINQKRFPGIQPSSTCSPSLAPSLASMQSSKFTFDPRSQSSNTQTKSGGSRCSTLQLDANETFNVEAWQNSKGDAAKFTPFGADISVIEASGDSPDITLNIPKQSRVDEDSLECCEVPVLSFLDNSAVESSGAPASTLLSRDNVSKIGKHRLLSGQLATYHRKDRASESKGASVASEDDSSILSDGSDVIMDLKNLSVQIQHHRSQPSAKSSIFPGTVEF